LAPGTSRLNLSEIRRPCVKSKWVKCLSKRAYPVRSEWRILRSSRDSRMRSFTQRTGTAVGHQEDTLKKRSLRRVVVKVATVANEKIPINYKISLKSGTPI
jgi:ribosomal protein L29